MHSASLTALAALLGSASATGVLLPLYVYPAAVYAGGPANWDPVLDAITANPDLEWLVVVNPGSGPDAPTEPEVNYIDGVAALNAYSNVKTIGYVHTSYATADLSVLGSNITSWKSWDTYTAADIAVDGIFFDESAADFDYMSSATALARDAFGDDTTIICNFGTSTAAEFYEICDVVVALETCLNCSDGPQYEGQTSINNNIPSGYADQSAILVNEFTGTDYAGKTADASLLETYLSNIVSNGVGWAYFCSGGYDSITTGPATVGQNAADLA
ncbi:Spherulation-specific family 4-domain-containing protein [Xylariales sp. PMI_506]|nr:Spherulation-specific family 4-domain-containing protein [Xylariales sp. PMI_506]